ncbi:MAG: TatD family hydrolase [Candidatus Altimarinota bacterium]
MIFDTHAHCYWDSLLPRIDEVLINMERVNIKKVVQIGCDLETSNQAINLAKEYPGKFYATVGLHPETAQDVEDFILVEALERLLISDADSIVAIGETGLDFHYLDGTEGGKYPIDPDRLTERAISQIETQKNWWRIQHELACKYDLPLVIHTRDARDATLKFMKEEGVGRAVMHCFSEDWSFARELMDFSNEIYFSFSGIVTYKNALKVQEAAKNIPINRLLIETDAPFLAPQPVRGQVCEPAFTRYTLEKIAELRGVSILDIEDRIYENSLRFYGVA